MGEEDDDVKRRRHTPEQVSRKLREAERVLAEGKTTAKSRDQECRTDTIVVKELGGVANDGRCLGSSRGRIRVESGSRASLWGPWLPAQSDAKPNRFEMLAPAIGRRRQPFIRG
jgi:hypothetical protein